LIDMVVIARHREWVCAAVLALALRRSRHVILS
jgi:hypothetical protein